MRRSFVSALATVLVAVPAFAALGAFRVVLIALLRRSLYVRERSSTLRSRHYDGCRKSKLIELLPCIEI